jgi:cytochrome c oxidase subunit 3
MPELNKATALRLGMLVFGALAIATLVEFGFALFAYILPVLVVLALIKAGLVMYYYMHIARLFEADSDPDQDSFSYKLMTNRMGLWFFMLSDSFIFGGLLVSRFNLLGLTRPGVNQYTGLAVTTVLLISSFFANRAETAMVHGDRKQVVVSTAVTITLGLLFLAGVLGVEWRNAPFSPAENVAAAIFFAMTGFHAFHVLTGITFLSIVLGNTLRMRYTPEKHWGVEAAVTYWHFIDVVWIIFYPALYLIGSLH